MFDKIESLTKRVLRRSLPREEEDGSWRISQRQMDKLLTDKKLAIQENWPTARIGLALRVHTKKHSVNVTIGRVGPHKFLVL